jgi:hypothetical protein
VRIFFNPNHHKTKSLKREEREILSTLFTLPRRITQTKHRNKNAPRGDHARTGDLHFLLLSPLFGGAILRFVVPGGENTILDWKKSIES